MPKLLKFKGREVEGVELDGVDASDYPKFCDAFICSAQWADTGKMLEDDELTQLQEEYEMDMNEWAHETFQ